MFFSDDNDVQSYFFVIYHSTKLVVNDDYLEKNTGYDIKKSDNIWKNFIHIYFFKNIGGKPCNMRKKVTFKLKKRNNFF